ncbi:hypothetical protein [Kitasatospora sp. GP82]|uniref:hypothetical protein n=1 Tax=Kitasatospora sp. GP82 TaxID=3035089 RepID=UPI0024743333|nr:hypothetical protein [Kitasatospora sp. GP82]MDH6123291.1 hypothetical protein [Kitasatospora sp. GP82]
MGTTMITKLTGQTVIAMPWGAPSQFGAAGTSISAAQLCDVVVLAEGGLGLDATGVSVVADAITVNGSTVSGRGNTDATSVESGLSRSGAKFEGRSELRIERPLQAPKAVVAAVKHGDYAGSIGAGAAQKQNEQLISQAEAAFTGATATRMRAFRGPGPWRERT